MCGYVDDVFALRAISANGCNKNKRKSCIDPKPSGIRVAKTFVWRRIKPRLQFRFYTARLFYFREDPFSALL